MPLLPAPLSKNRWFFYFLMAGLAIQAVLLSAGMLKNMGLLPFQNRPVHFEKVELTPSDSATMSGVSSASAVSSSMSGYKKNTSPTPKAASLKPSLQPLSSPAFRPCTQADWDSCPKPKDASQVDAYRACMKPKCDSTFSYQEIHPEEVQELPPDIKEAYDRGEGTEVQ